MSNDMRGLDLGAGLDTVCELLGITDVEGLIQRLLVIKSHRPPKPDDPPREL